MHVTGWLFKFDINSLYIEMFIFNYKSLDVFFFYGKVHKHTT